MLLTMQFLSDILSSDIVHNLVYYRMLLLEGSFDILQRNACLVRNGYSYDALAILSSSTALMWAFQFFTNLKYISFFSSLAEVMCLFWKQTYGASNSAVPTTTPRMAESCSTGRHIVMTLNPVRWLVEALLITPCRFLMR